MREYNTSLIDQRLTTHIDFFITGYDDYNIFLEVIISIFFFFINYYIIYYSAKNRIKNPKLSKIFIYGWLMRVSLGIFTVLVYKLYYGGGDTWNYMRDANKIVRIATQAPLTLLQYILHSIINRDFIKTLIEMNDMYYIAIYQNEYFLIYSIDYSSEMVALFSSLAAFLGLKSYYAMIIWTSTFSFLGSWLIYLVFLRYFPRYKEAGAVGVIFLPSLSTWTGSPFKETYAIIGLGLSVYGIYQILHEKKWLWLPIIIFGAWMIYTVKPYVILAMLPWAVVWIYLTLNRFTKHSIYKYFFSPLLFISFALLSYFTLIYLSESTQKYRIDNVADQAYSVYTDLRNNYTYYTETGGSVYDIGDFEPTIQGMLSKFPIATLTALFRPFLWEAGKAVVFLAALETTALVIIILINIWRHSVFKIIRNFFSHPFLFFCFVYGIFFLFMTGLTSGNFGNLVRYRVPGYIFFISALFIIFAKLRHESHCHRQRERRPWRRVGGGSAWLDR